MAVSSCQAQYQRVNQVEQVDHFIQFLFWIKHSVHHSCFSDFVFKIRLIRLGFSFKKNFKIPVLYLNSKPTDSQLGVITTAPQIQLWEGDTENLSVTFSYAWLILVEFT